MVRHSILTGLHNHRPQGLYPELPAVLQGGQPNAYLIEDNSGFDWMRFDTSANTIYLGSGLNQTIQIGDGGTHALALNGYFRLAEQSSAPLNIADVGILYTRDASGVTQLRYMDSGGTVHELTPVNTGANSTGTTSSTYTINTDAANNADENASLVMIGSDDDTGTANDDLVRSTLTLDAANERLYLTLDRNRNGAGYTRIVPRVGIGTPGSTTSGFDPMLEFHTGNGTTAFTGALSYVIASGVGYLQSSGGRISSPGTSGNSEIFGYRSTGSGDAVAVGYSAAATGGTSIGPNTATSGTGNIAIAGGGAGATASGSNCLVVAPGTASTATHTRALLLGDDLASTANNQFMVRTTSTIFGNGDVHVLPPAVTSRVTNASGNDVSASHWTIVGGRGTGSGSGGDIILQTAGPGSNGSSLNPATDVLRVYSSGRVSIGNVGASALAQLHVLTNTSSTSTTMLIDQDGSGDAGLRWDAGTSSFICGVDNSASDRWALSESTTLGTNDRIRIDVSNGAITHFGTEFVFQRLSAIPGTAVRYGSSAVLTTVDTGSATFDIALPVTTGAGYIHIDVIAVQRSSLNTAAIPRFVHWEMSAGTAAIIADTQDTDFDSIDALFSGITVAVTASGGNARVTVTGVILGGPTTIDWVVHYRLGGLDQT